jgi:NAD(P)H-flavin reductase
VLVIVGVLVLAFFVARGCQQTQVRIDKQQAVATATDAVDFEPRRTNVRLLRQGLNSKPYWFVNLSVPGSAEGTVRRLSVVQIDANTGKVLEIDKQR